jgi:hypothetical protein
MDFCVFFCGQMGDKWRKNLDEDGIHYDRSVLDLHLHEYVSGALILKEGIPNE